MYTDVICVCVFSSRCLTCLFFLATAFLCPPPPLQRPIDRRSLIADTMWCYHRHLVALGAFFFFFFNVSLLVKGTAQPTNRHTLCAEVRLRRLSFQRVFRKKKLVLPKFAPSVPRPAPPLPRGVPLALMVWFGSVFLFFLRLADRIGDVHDAQRLRHRGECPGTAC